MSNVNSIVQPGGSVSMFVARGQRQWPTIIDRGVVREHGLPNRDASDKVNEWRMRNIRNLARGIPQLKLARWLGIPTYQGALFGRVIRGNGEVEDLGLMSLRVVTTVGVGYIVDAFQNLVELENMKFHGFGTGTTAEASADTALVTELTTQYVSNVRPTGTTTEASATVYRTVATLAPDSGGTIAVTEHGIFSADSAGVLLDRTVFSAVNLVASSDSLQVTYDLTLTAGG